eukprot:3119084-Amphidinium_carterae.3
MRRTNEYLTVDASCMLPAHEGGHADEAPKEFHLVRSPPANVARPAGRHPIWDNVLEREEGTYLDNARFHVRWKAKRKHPVHRLLKGANAFFFARGSSTRPTAYQPRDHL